MRLPANRAGAWRPEIVRETPTASVPQKRTALYAHDCPPGSTPEQIAKPIRVIRILHDPTLSNDELAAAFGATYAGECS